MNNSRIMKSALRWQLVWLLTLFLAFTLAGCKRASRQMDEAPEVNMTLEAAPNPPEVGATRLIVTLNDDTGAPINGANLEIRGDMIHAGMEPVIAEVAGGQSGRYETPFEWTMGGDWVVTVSATLPDGRVSQNQFDLTVAGEMNMEEGDMNMNMEENMPMETKVAP